MFVSLTLAIGVVLAGNDKPPTGMASANEPRSAPQPSAVQKLASIQGLALESATFEDARRAFGPAEVRHNQGDAAGSAHLACYVGADGTTLVLDAHAEQGAGTITSFQLVRRRELADFREHGYQPPVEALPRCGRSARVARATRTGGGLRLGMTCAEAARRLGVAPKESTSAGCSFVLEDKERPVRLRTGEVVGLPSAWFTIGVERGRAVSIRIAYSSMI